MSRKTILIIVILSTFLILPSCGWYTYNGKTYNTPQKALSAQSSFISNWMSQVNSYSSPSYSSALFLIPSYDAIKDKGITVHGHAQLDETSRSYLARVLQIDLNSCGRALSKRNYFESVTTKSAMNTEKEVAKYSPIYDAVVYLKLINPKQFGWFVITSTSNTETPLSFNTALAPGAPRINNWLDNIESIVNRNALTSEKTRFRTGKTKAIIHKSISKSSTISHPEKTQKQRYFAQKNLTHSKHTDFRGLAWGNSIDVLEGFEYLHTDPSYGGIRVYQRNSDKMKIGAAKLKDIRYGFWRKKLVFVNIIFKGYTNFSGVKDAAIKKFGTPYQDNQFIERYTWFKIPRSSVMLEYSDISKRGTMRFNSKKYSEIMQTDAAKKAQKGAEDDF